MGLLFWKKNKVIDLFATRLADEFYSNLPPEQLTDLQRPSDESGKHRKQEKKLQRNLDAVVNSAAEQINNFIRTESLGVYGKARVHMQFAERLTELGYDKDMSGIINERIMLKVSGTS